MIQGSRRVLSGLQLLAEVRVPDWIGPVLAALEQRDRNPEDNDDGCTKENDDDADADGGAEAEIGDIEKFNVGRIVVVKKRDRDDGDGVGGGWADVDQVFAGIGSTVGAEEVSIRVALPGRARQVGWNVRAGSKPGWDFILNLDWSEL